MRRKWSCHQCDSGNEELTPDLWRGEPYGEGLRWCDLLDPDLPYDAVPEWRGRWYARDEPAESECPGYSHTTLEDLQAAFQALLDRLGSRTPV